MKIAIIGSGISGLGAAYILNPNHEVTLFEADSRFGGHSYTVDVNLENQNFPVDTGFLVHNNRTYPHLIQLFKKLNIETHPSEMSLSVKIEDINLEWAGTSLSSLFIQRKNLISLPFLRMIRDILKINRNKEAYLEKYKSNVTLEQFFIEEKFSKEFIEWYFIPMGACIWSTPSEEMLKYPAGTILRFCLNHGLLQVMDRPQWKTVVGGSRVYVKKIVDTLKDARLNSPVTKVERKKGFIEVTTPQGSEAFEKVIFATHAPTTMRMISDLGSEESALLSNFKFQDNTAYLHTDESFLPSDKKAWSSWNFHSGSAGLSKKAVGLTYLINMLQKLPTEKPVMVTLNPHRPIDPSKVIQVINYDHPLFDEPAIAAQSRLHSIQGLGGYYYAGAWTRYGFHEDGILSAVQVCELLGVHIPWRA